MLAFIKGRLENFKCLFLVPENANSESGQMLKKKKRERDRMVGTAGETRLVPKPLQLEESGKSPANVLNVL